MIAKHFSRADVPSDKTDFLRGLCFVVIGAESLRGFKKALLRLFSLGIASLAEVNL